MGPILSRDTGGPASAGYSPKTPVDMAMCGSVLRFRLWAHVDLNHGPHPYQGCALTGLSYGPRILWY